MFVRIWRELAADAPLGTTNTAFQAGDNQLTKPVLVLAMGQVHRQAAFEGISGDKLLFLPQDWPPSLFYQPTLVTCGKLTNMASNMRGSSSLREMRIDLLGRHIRAMS